MILQAVCVNYSFLVSLFSKRLRTNKDHLLSTKKTKTMHVLHTNTNHFLRAIFLSVTNSLATNVLINSISLSAKASPNSQCHPWSELVDRSTKLHLLKSFLEAMLFTSTITSHSLASLHSLKVQKQKSFIHKNFAYSRLKYYATIAARGEEDEGE
jgi:hypothetical protein